MRILLNERIEHQSEDKILVVREFDPAEEYAARNTVGLAIDISLDDPRFNESVETNPSGDAYDVTLKIPAPKGRYLH